MPGTPAAWVAGDEVYGADPACADLERRRIGYVLAVATNCRIPIGAGACQAGVIARRMPRSAWPRYSAGHGAKGDRYYDWAWVAIDPHRPGYRWLLIRRNRQTKELAFYRCCCPRHIPLATLVKVAGLRWTAEENFQASKGMKITNLRPEHQPGQSGSGAALRNREPLNSTVELVTRRQKGQMDGVTRSSIRAPACLPRRSSMTTRSTASTGCSATQKPPTSCGRNPSAGSR
jgi:hypothetical protein